MLSLDPKSTASEQSHAFYRRCGMTAELAETVANRGPSYLKWVSPLPLTFTRLLAGDTLAIGGRRFIVHSGDGHAPEQVSLYCPEDGLLLAADQVIEKITPNISVWALEPDGDPLGHFMRTLRELGSRFPEDVLVLPGHLRPFRGLQQRCTEILSHHEARCRLIFEACREAPNSVDQLVPILFRGKTANAGELSFAFTETVAHVNRLIRRGELARETVGDRWIFRSA
jgi:glyoxylase-like metal-dependent hydrolase (beta-lactamase superfamily II)